MKLSIKKQRVAHLGLCLLVAMSVSIIPGKKKLERSIAHVIALRSDLLGSL